MPAVIPQPQSLVGRFVRLDPLRPDDIDELREAIARPEVFASGYGGGPGGLDATVEGFRAFAMRTYRWQDGRPFAIRLAAGPDEGRLVGTSTLADFEPAREATHIGWTAYDPRVWGTAVNPESKLLLLAHAFAHGFGRVKIQTNAENARSRAAIAKLGATFEGIARRDALRADGTWRDAAVFSITVDDWPAVRAGLEGRLAAAGVPTLGTLDA